MAGGLSLLGSAPGGHLLTLTNRYCSVVSRAIPTMWPSMSMTWSGSDITGMFSASSSLSLLNPIWWGEVVLSTNQRSILVCVNQSEINISLCQPIRDYTVCFNQSNLVLPNQSRLFTWSCRGIWVSCHHSPEHILTDNTASELFLIQHYSLVDDWWGLEWWSLSDIWGSCCHHWREVSVSEPHHCYQQSTGRNVHS